MRADRLVAILLLLQVHGRLTAPELARRLETSVRTVRRDLEALGSAGVPVYPQRGRGGGWSLLGGHRIDLTGLTGEEAQALFLATSSASTAELGPGWSDGLSAARRKVMAALPEPLRAQVEAVGATTLVDRSRWGRPPEPAGAAGPDESHLPTLRQATMAGLEVAIEYEPPGRPAEERTVQPRGLVCKRGVWYLVATAPAGLRTYRVSRVRAVRLTDTPVRGSPGFDLATAWEGIQRELTSRLRPELAVRVALPESTWRRLQARVGSWWPIEDAGADPAGRRIASIRFPTTAVAASELIGLTEDVEVLEPEEVRRELAEAGRRLLARYGVGRDGAEYGGEPHRAESGTTA